MRAAHVPNALYAHLDRDLSSAVTPTSGRHPLPARESFSATLGRWGVDGKVQIVAYDQGSGAYASQVVVARALGRARPCRSPERWLRRVATGGIADQ